MNVPAPVAVGYLVAADKAALARQEESVASYAKAEGLALAEVLPGDRHALTISQVIDAVRRLEAKLVLVPADAALAETRNLLNERLAGLGAACVVVGPATGKSEGPAP